MYFYEKLGLLQYAAALLFRTPVRYYKRSFPLMALWKVLFFLPKNNTFAKGLNFGDVESYAGILQGVNENAEAYLGRMRHEKFFRLSAGLFGIDFIPVFRKYIFNQVLCTRYEFIELAVRYAREHPDEKHVFYISSPHLLSAYLPEMSKADSVRTGRRFFTLEFCAALFVCPVLLWWHWKRNGQKDTHYFRDAVICNAVKMPTRDMFKELLGSFSQTCYVMTLPYLNRYKRGEVEKAGVIPLRLSRDAYVNLRREVRRYIRICLQCRTELVMYGWEMLRLFFHIIMGREIAPHGRGNVFITFEHFDSTLAIRNEFIRAEGSRSVFFSKNLNVYCKHDFDEAYTNYDILCSSGKMLEDHLSIGRVRTETILRTGGYDMHKIATGESKRPHGKVSELKAFSAGAGTVITVLSCGLVDKSYAIERKLMDLTVRLSRQPGVKIFIRFKTRYEMPRHDVFYDQFVQGQDSIMMTGAECELTDFLPVTDLFITSLSNSGFDVIMRGGSAVFVDFLHTPDLFRAWELFRGVVLAPESAFEYIMTWVRDNRQGPVRTRHRGSVDQLREYVGYAFSDFDAYKENMIDQLRRHSPLFEGIGAYEQV